MVRKFLLSGLAVSLFASLPFVPESRLLCDGFLPENNLKIPVSLKGNKGITEAEFNEVLDKVEQVYAPLIAAKGGNLQVKRLWTNETVNASAQQWGSTWIINMYGGLARHEAITQDGFALVACHEIGHHMGGFPRTRGWASNEGQSDYFATLKCLRLVYAQAGGFSRASHATPFMKKKCGESYSNNADRALCARLAMGGMSVSSLFQIGRGEDKAPEFDTPDPKVVGSMLNSHPPTQCRLDTYFSGSICPKSVSDEVSAGDPAAGVCTRAEGYSWEAKPLCWYKPPASAQEDAQIVKKNIDASPVKKMPSAFKKEGSVFSALERMAGSSR